jgi:hypothetical protein
MEIQCRAGEEQATMTYINHTLFAGSTSFASPLNILEWNKAAKPGEKYVYAFGHPPVDSKRPGGVLLCETMRVASRLMTNDKIFLFQKKIGEGLYEYIAVKRGDEDDQQRRTS